ncbi:tRNA lysidine(34) synthetase TilS [Alkalihalobacillus sp. CinArs1]|uniref:tRNA lysidine(34) synthetase TilS n=1 Tax=Alkalihalobacillus sp. CinArs1 TaxID=2995314 RepID=UPI0022DD77B6|nr:tRNA lysidine(34) synthetase TilS [Alkalihalobacillus sp. CinArs1]
MQQDVDRFIQKHDLLHEGDVVVAGVSGGPDSVALLHYLNKLGLKLIAAHVDHKLRGAESAEDLSFVKRMCEREGIQFESASIDVEKYKKEKGVSTQVAARECRYDFFHQVMNKYNATSLALAHHGDDQIETMLMRQVHGSISGLSGIAVKRKFASGLLIRPLLGVTKEQILSYCEEHSLPFRIDPSNESDNYMRNRFRKQVLPFLKEENPNVHVRYQLYSERMQSDEDYLMELAGSRLDEVIIDQNDKIVKIDNKSYHYLPIPLQRRVIHLILNYLYKSNAPFSSIHIEDLRSLLDSEHPSASLDLPLELRAVKSYDTCCFTFETFREVESYTKQLDSPGSVETPLGTITATLVDELPLNLSGEDLIIESTMFPVTVRSRRAGDRIQPKGMIGTKKVKDIFIDRKINRSERDSWPIVESSDGTIIWVAGLTRSEKVTLPAKRKKLVHLHYEKNYLHRLGGQDHRC